MLVSGDEVIQEYKKIWPDFEFNMLLDKKFKVPKLVELENFFNRSKLNTLKFVPELNDCDDYAFNFKMEVQRYRYYNYMSKIAKNLDPGEDAFPFPLSVAFGNLWRGMNMLHATGLCLTEEGVKGVDLTPQLHRIWVPSGKSDNPLFGVA